jgi:hypothetical protein
MRTQERNIEMANSSQPAYRCFTAIKREGQDDFWLPIGAAFRHGQQAGDGLNVVLQALPLPGPDWVCKIVLRPPKDDGDANDEKTKQAVRQENDRRHGRSR